MFSSTLTKMEHIEILLQAVRSTLNSLLPFAPVLLFCIIAERTGAVYTVKASRVIINLLYVVVSFSVVHSFLLPHLYDLNRFIPSNIWGIDERNYSNSQKILLWCTYLVCFDFLYYCFHRAQHTFGFMWRYHMVHHSDENISASAFARHHWLEDFWRYPVITIPLFFSFGSVTVPFIVVGLIGFFAIMMHWNTRLRFGPLERIVITPSYHRIHHSIEEKHYNKNYGALFQIWDHVFQTRYIPSANEFPRTGIKNFDENNLLALLLPWPWIISQPLETETIETDSAISRPATQHRLSDHDN